MINKEEAGHFAKACNLGGERKVVEMFQRIVEPCMLISTVLEMPQVIMGVLRVFSLIVVRECIQGSPILTVISRIIPMTWGSGPMMTLV